MMVATVVVINLTEGPARRGESPAWAPRCSLRDALVPFGWQSISLWLSGRALPLVASPQSVSSWKTCLFGSLAAAPIYLAATAPGAVRALRDAKLRRVSAERQETEARLQSLQAQIEPHFLFNTLAHILRLHQVDAQRGRAMLQSLTEYMRSALPQMRGRRTSRSGASWR